MLKNITKIKERSAILSTEKGEITITWEEIIAIMNLLIYNEIGTTIEIRYREDKK